MLGLIDGEVNIGRRGLVTPLLAPLTGECLGRRPGEAPPRPAGESPAVALQPRGLVEAQHNDDLFGKHRCLDLAPQPAETKPLPPAGPITSNPTPRGVMIDASIADDQRQKSLNRCGDSSV